MLLVRSTKRGRLLPILSAVLCAFVVAGCSRPDSADQYTTWMNYGGGADQSKYSKLDRIDKSNVSQLSVAWSYATGDNTSYQFNPIIVDTVMYVLAKNSSLVALHAVTGEELWIHANLNGIARRGINYWESKDRSDRRLIFQINDYLQEIDAHTGQSIRTFGKDGLVDLREGLGRDPGTIARAQSGTPGAIFENLIILGASTGEGFLSTPGFLRAYDILTGDLAWTFHTIPQPGEFGYDTWPKDAYKYIGGVNTWGEISLDAERGIAYFPVGSPTYDYYGADRIGANLFGNCLLALDARTGERLWHYQLVHHDLWDYDPSAAPQLVTVNHGGKAIDAVAIATKHGFLFAFDRVTGEPLWPIEERAVPASDLPGEEAWPTQPFPTILPPFARQQMTSADLTPFFLNPDEREEWTRKIDSMQTGLFTPLSHLKATVTQPGAVGGANWGSTAANPATGMVYVRSIDWPSFYGKMIRQEAPDEQAEAAGPGELSGDALYVQYCQACHANDRSGGVGPSLVGLSARMQFNEFHQLVSGGRGEMPALHHLDEEAVQRLYRYLARLDRMSPQRTNDTVEGPVVASGGIPGGLELRKAPNLGSYGGNDFGPPYPAGVEAPSLRYFVPPGWGLEHPYLISPPWSTITAYDLNEGTIKWTRAIGEDKMAAAEGGKNTGVPRAQRNGMIVTATGLLFSTSKDGKIYAFDAETGEQLWAGDLPMGTEGLPSLYRVGGRDYLVVCASTPIRWSIDKGEGDEQEQAGQQGQYVVFSLPENVGQ
ncbi:outer membrane protein assembly factor BamB family protein [Parapedobacter koreensis]|uniref:outer membrane protein assembly factor BamB family protein n=1 Tax=Parapedobacter koreensis TaxID=332977 RepID=UPI0015A6EB09|nr:PQQ-binding-like beta-propeller repeat protein [Parapedobacter koreensis]